MWSIAPDLQTTSISPVISEYVKSFKEITADFPIDILLNDGTVENIKHVLGVENKIIISNILKYNTAIIADASINHLHIASRYEILHNLNKEVVDSIRRCVTDIDSDAMVNDFACQKLITILEAVEALVTFAYHKPQHVPVTPDDAVELTEVTNNFVIPYFYNKDGLLSLGSFLNGVFDKSEHTYNYYILIDGKSGDYLWKNMKPKEDGS
jgi:hypothetical protein